MTTTATTVEMGPFRELMISLGRLKVNGDLKVNYFSMLAKALQRDDEMPIDEVVQTVVRIIPTHYKKTIPSILAAIIPADSLEEALAAWRLQSSDITADPELVQLAEQAKLAAGGLLGYVLIKLSERAIAAMVRKIRSR